MTTFGKMSCGLLLTFLMYIVGYQCLHVVILDDVKIKQELLVLDKNINSDQYGANVYYLHVKDASGIVTDITTTSEVFYNVKMNETNSLMVHNPQVSSGLLVTALILEMLGGLVLLFVLIALIFDRF